VGPWGCIYIGVGPWGCIYIGVGPWGSIYIGVGSWGCLYFCIGIHALCEGRSNFGMRIVGALEQHSDLFRADSAIGGWREQNL